METTNLHLPSCIQLLEESFPGIQNNISRWESLGFSWNTSKLFVKEIDKKIVSHVALLEKQALIKEEWYRIGMLHGICTQAAYRKHGLATELIQEALQWSKEHCEMLFLFTEIPDFYEKCSFRKVQEYRFYLPYIHSKGTRLLQPVIAPKDNNLFISCFQERAPLSNRFWVKDDGSIASFNAFFATYPTYWSFYYSSAIDGLLSFEIKDNALHLYDVVAKTIPSLNFILEHILTPIRGVYFYFSPDLLTNTAVSEPYIYDNGHLMEQGLEKIVSPFMVSPLSRS